MKYVYYSYIILVISITKLQDVQTHLTFNAIFTNLDRKYLIVNQVLKSYSFNGNDNVAFFFD